MIKEVTAVSCAMTLFPAKMENKDNSIKTKQSLRTLRDEEIS
jgi:hypothetical protein